MRALTVDPGAADSLELAELPDPTPGPGELLVEGVSLGICGTDREIVRGEFGVGGRLVLGHESLGRVVQPSGPFRAGDFVVGVVRRPDPEPCAPCAAGEFDMCANGRYTERGITGIDGYGSTLWTAPARYAVRVDPSLAPVGVLVEPTSVVVKAWERITRFGSGSRVLVTGAGPIGLLAALIGVQRGLDVHVVDRATDGPKPKLVSRLGASYHTSLPAGLAPDVAIEATGAPGLVFPVLESLARNGVLCLTGVPSSEVSSVDVGLMNRNMVLGNQVVFGSVNSNLTHYREAASVLLEADLSWLEGLITRRVPLDGYAAAFSASPDDVKVVIDL